VLAFSGADRAVPCCSTAPRPRSKCAQNTRDVPSFVTVVTDRLAQLMGFTIEATSEVGVGSTFSLVLLPNAVPAPQEAPAAFTHAVPRR
jgi:hypothetical protein